MGAIRAAVTRAFGAPSTIETLTLARPGPGEVQVRVAACAICHSDMAYADGHWGGPLPAVWGHEAAGTVVDVGAGVDLAVGDRVVVTLARSCGTCDHCRRGQQVACTGSFVLDERSPLTDESGEPVHQGLRTAAFAEEVVVHGSQVVAVPADLAPTAASLLGCAVISGVGAVANTAAVEPGSSVVVIGCGGVGLNVVQGARLAGAASIVAVDPEAAKLEVAARLGATHLVDPTAEDTAEAVARATGGFMADYVFVAVGAAAAFQQGLAMVGTMGAMVLVGMPASGVTIEIEPGDLAHRSQRILGSKLGNAVVGRDIPALVTSYQAGQLELDALVSGTFALDEIDRAMDEVRQGSALRNVVVFE